MKLTKLRSLFAINQFFHFLPLGLLFPVSTLYLLEMGFSLGIIGTALACYSFTVFLLEIPTGGLADRMGRIGLYRISLLVNLLTNVLFLFCQNSLILFIAMITMGIARALSSGSFDAWYVDNHDQKDRETLQKSMAFSAGIVPAALGISTLLGGFLPDLDRLPQLSLAGWNIYSANILLAITAILIHLLFLALFVREGKETVQEKQPFNHFLKDTLKMAWGSKVLRLMLMISFALGIGLSSVENFWQPQVKNLVPESPSFLLGILSALYFFSASIGSLFSSSLLRGLGEKKTLLLMKIFHGLTLLFMGAWAGLYGFALFFTLTFIFHGASNGPHNTLLNEAIPPEKRSSLLSLDSFSLIIGAGLGSAFFGWIAEYQSIALVWVIAGIIIGLSALLYLPLKLDKEKSHEA